MSIDGAAVTAIAILLLFCALLAGLHRIRNHPLAQPERLRKTLHIATGSAAFAFPFLFETPAPVWALVGIILVIMVLRRGDPATRTVTSRGYGELFMPLAIAVLFSLSRGQPPALYWLPLFFLVFADSLAALVGTQIGRHAYGSKTLEGTATFLAVALAGSRAVLPPPAAAALALGATALEHLSWRGFDNLSVPLGSYLLLAILTGTPIGAASP